MSGIGAISTTPPSVAHSAILTPPNKDKRGDEATESPAAKAAEAPSPHKVNIKA
jgi:hypothetical protein